MASASSPLSTRTPRSRMRNSSAKLESKDALHHDVRKHLSEALSLHPAFRQISIIYDEAACHALGVCPAADSADKLAVDGVYEASPIHASINHTAIERILLAGEQLAQTIARIIGSILHGEEREQNEQFHQLNEGKLAVRILNKTDYFGLYDEAIHHCCYTLYCLASTIMLEKALEFTDYWSILWLCVLYVSITTTM